MAEEEKHSDQLRMLLEQHRKDLLVKIQTKISNFCKAVVINWFLNVAVPAIKQSKNIETEEKLKILREELKKQVSTTATRK